VIGVVVHEWYPVPTTPVPTTVKVMHAPKHAPKELHIMYAYYNLRATYDNTDMAHACAFSTLHLAPWARACSSCHSTGITGMQSQASQEGCLTLRCNTRIPCWDQAAARAQLACTTAASQHQCSRHTQPCTSRSGSPAIISSPAMQPLHGCPPVPPSHPSTTPVALSQHPARKATKGSLHHAYSSPGILCMPQQGLPL
jgi:hypothetical protein